MNEIAKIPESYFEYRAEFLRPMFEAWSQPTRILEGMFELLQRWNVSLANAHWEKEPKTIREGQLGFNVEKLSSVMKVGIDSATFIALNPDWGDADNLLTLFESSLGK
jgi:hypothetical protein